MNSRLRNDLTKLLPVSALTIAALAACSQNGEQSGVGDLTKLVPQPPSNGSQPQLPPQQAAQEELKTVPDLLRGGGLSDGVVLCTVGAERITAGDYRRAYMFQLANLPLAASMPASQQALLDKARDMKIKLTEADKVQLLKTAKQTQVPKNMTFAEFLKKRRIREADFVSRVYDFGLAFKTGNKILEDGILDLIVQERLLLGAAKKAGLEQAANTRYMEKARTKPFQDFQKATKLPADQFKAAAIESELVELMKEKIRRETKPKESDKLAQKYEQNKRMFRHDGRVRWSQILVTAPLTDGVPSEVIRETLTKANPKAKPADIERFVQGAEKVKQIDRLQRDKAQALLQKAIAGADFAELANANTDDVTARQVKSGGDMGITTTNSIVALEPLIGNELKAMSPGQVCPRLIRTAVGYHIIKLTVKEGPGVLPIEEATERLKFQLTLTDPDWAVKQWLADEKASVPIKVSDEFRAVVATSKQPGAPQIR